MPTTRQGSGQIHLHADAEAGKPLDIDALLDNCPAGDRLYVCGPKVMLDAVLARTQARGWEHDRVHFELFTEPVVEEGDHPFEVELAQSGQRFTVPADQSILDCLIEHGCDPMFDCKRGECGVCSTPRRLYEVLAQQYVKQMPWERTHWFFGDERCVPHAHAESNFAMVRKAMFAPATVSAANVHPIPTTGFSPDEAAADYERELKTYYGADRFDPQRPLFDVALLGVGEDGHTASLFPGTPALTERKRWVAAVAGAAQARITLTYPALESSGETLCLVSGANKRDILARIWRGDDLPITRLRPAGTMHWMIDRAADPR